MNTNERSQMVKEYTFENVVSLMRYKTINAISIVFTGPLLRSNTNRVFSETNRLKFKKVADIPS